jgi:hypothetical protein
MDVGETLQHKVLGLYKFPASYIILMKWVHILFGALIVFHEKGQHIS